MAARKISTARGHRKAPDLVDLAWVQALTGATAGTVEARVDEAREDQDLAGWVHELHLQGGREFYAQIRAPFELYALVRILRPHHVVEVGVSSGVSSAYFLRALERNRTGRLHSIDLPTSQKGKRFSARKDSPVALPPGRTTGWAVPPELRADWDLRLGPSQQLLPDLIDELDRVDLFLHDSLHTFEHATFELTTVDPKVPPGGVFLADNTEWLGGALDRFAESKGTRASYRTGMDLGGFAKPNPARRTTRRT